jgi:hypothetical protein
MFAAVLLQINLTDHRILFRTYPYTFTTDEAAKVMSSLVFIHVHRNTDPLNPSRLVATRTTTTFSMDYNSAKSLIQQFLSARLIMSATDPTNCTVKDKGLWCPTLKGKCVLEEFTNDTQVDMSDTLKVALQGLGGSGGGRLLSLDRLNDNDDQITFSRPNMTATFKAMMASLPRDSLMVDEFSGIEKSRLAMFQYTFVGSLCIEWLCDRLTVTCREEAESVASEFVLFGWIAQVLDKADKRHYGKSNHNMFFNTDRDAIYYVTERGCIVTGWKISSDTKQNDDQSGISLDSDSSTDKSLRRSPMVTPPVRTRKRTQDSQNELFKKYEEPSTEMIRQDSLAIASSISSSISNETVIASPSQPIIGQQRPIHIHLQRPPSMSITTDSIAFTTKDNSQWNRLKQILETPLLRMYFREFLRANYCAENMSFWVDHHKLLSKNNESVLDQIAACYSIYETYLGSNATADVNIDHTLHQQITSYVANVFAVVNQPPPSNVVYFVSPITTAPPISAVPSQPKTLLMSPQATKQQIVTLRGISPEQCLNTLLQMLSRVNDHVCCMMAEDSVPKFIKTDKYKELIAQKERQEEEDSSSDEDMALMTRAFSAQRMDHQRH